MTAPIREPSRQRLTELEHRFETAQGQALAGAIEMGRVLAIIREERQYHADGHETFDAYTRDRLDMRREQADTLIRVATTADAIEATGLPLPTSQRALLALAPVADDQTRLTEVWGQALEQSARPSGAQVDALMGEGKRARLVESPYADELADPDGWRVVMEAIKAEQRRSEGMAFSIPRTWEDNARQLAALVIEGDALHAGLAATLIDWGAEARKVEAGSEVAREESHRYFVDEHTDRIWEASDAAFKAWPPLRDFWVAADRHDWFDVRGYVGMRLAGYRDDEDGWNTHRAVAVLSLLTEDGG